MSDFYIGEPVNIHKGYGYVEHARTFGTHLYLFRFFHDGAVSVWRMECLESEYAPFGLWGWKLVHRWTVDT